MVYELVDLLLKIFKKKLGLLVLYNPPNRARSSESKLEYYRTHYRSLYPALNLIVALGVVVVFLLITSVATLSTANILFLSLSNPASYY